MLDRTKMKVTAYVCCNNSKNKLRIVKPRFENSLPGAAEDVGAGSQALQCLKSNQYNFKMSPKP